MKRIHLLLLIAALLALLALTGLLLVKKPHGFHGPLSATDVSLTDQSVATSTSSGNPLSITTHSCDSKDYALCFGSGREVDETVRVTGVHVFDLVSTESQALFGVVKGTNFYTIEFNTDPHSYSDIEYASFSKKVAELVRNLP